MSIFSSCSISFSRVLRILVGVLVVGWSMLLSAATAPCLTVAQVKASETHAVPGTVYVLGDSISYGLAQDGLADKLQERFGSKVRISFDIGRSITTPGIQIKKSALESVERDKAFIAKADTIIVVLGTNQMEKSFANSQQLLMWQLKALAPNARYFWVDIGATMANQAQGWSARNRVIYDNAAALGYQVISRYKAIFGADADPLSIVPGRNFPGMITEPGYGAEGNLHGADAALTQAILQALGAVPAALVHATVANARCGTGG